VIHTRSYFRKFGLDLALLAGAAVLSGILAMAFLGLIFKHREIGSVHIALDSSSKEVHSDLPVGKLPSSYNFITFDLATEFIAFSQNNYQNIFQTDQFNDGIRLEVSPECDVALLTNSSKEIVPMALPRCVFGRQYKLVVSYDANGIFHAFINGKTLKAHKLPKLTPAFKAFAFKNGFNGERPFYGEVTIFELKASLYKRNRWLGGFIIALSAICLAGTFYIFVRILGNNFLIAEGEPICRNES